MHKYNTQNLKNSTKAAEYQMELKKQVEALANLTEETIEIIGRRSKMFGWTHVPKHLEGSV